MPDQNVDPQPTPRFRIPRMAATISNLGLSDATATRDEYSGVVTVAIGTFDQRVVLADDPAVLTVLEVQQRRHRCPQGAGTQAGRPPHLREGDGASSPPLVRVTGSSPH